MFKKKEKTIKTQITYINQYLGFLSRLAESQHEVPSINIHTILILL